MTAKQATQYLQNQPVTITSEYAEIIYFLRNGNLYRRVLLVAPELQTSIPGLAEQHGCGFLITTYPPANPTLITSNPSHPKHCLRVRSPGELGKGVVRTTCRPGRRAPGPTTISPKRPESVAQQTIILNSLGDLTNRENRFAYPRFANDFFDSATGKFVPDGIPDDINVDNVPDVYPTFYPNIFNTGLINAPNYTLPSPVNNNNNGVVPLLSFPFIFPGAYSHAQTVTNYATGWIHSPDPIVDVTQIPGTTYQFGGNNQTLSYLQNMNHNPLDLGDNLNIPPNSTADKKYLTTWWGFPTWRETLSPYWNDPTYQINLPANLTQPNLLSPLGWFANEVFNGAVSTSRVMLPPMTPTWRPYNPQLSTDGYGDTTNLFPVANGNPPALWTGSWEDDLIMTGVRSFDVKAYDNAYAGYADLGWADDLRLYTPYSTIANYVSPGVNPLGLASQPITPGYTGFVWPPLASGTLFNPLTQTLAHEGRMPPLVEDLVFDARHGAATNYLPPNSPYLPPNGTYTGNIGDDNNTTVVRLRRVWDSWSTEYSRAPDVAVNAASGFPAGYPWAPPVYPSYPAPYQAPLRGIQIQVRVVDPSNQRIKSITIVQDFTDKL